MIKPATPATPAEKMPELKYEITEAGDIVRTDKDGPVTVARYKEEVLTIIPQWSRFRAQVVRFLNAEDKKVSSIVNEGDIPDAPKENIPPCPKPTMRDGDKTPAVVEWFKKYKPAEYRARYGIQGPGTVTKTRKEENPERPGQMRSVAYQVDAIIAERKTHLTEKVESSDGNGKQYADE